MLFYCGMCSCISFPFIGVFDCVKFLPIHYTCASLYFICSAAYIFSLTRLMKENKDRFPIQDKEAIDANYKFSFFMLALITIMILSAVIMGVKFWSTPLLEWASVFCIMNFFSILNFRNPFYNSVHQFSEDRISENV